MLNLEKQPRAIVLHSKEGRTHGHVVYSRIDAQLKAIKLPFYKKRMQQLSKELYLENGWALPKGMQNKQSRSQTNYDLGEAHIAKRQKRDPKIIKAQIKTLWDDSPDIEAFKSALSDAQYILAKGDRRGFVLVDIFGDVRSLTRTIGVKAKAVKEKLGVNDSLPTVEEAKQTFTASYKQDFFKRREVLITRHQAQLSPHTSTIRALVKKQKSQRNDLSKTQATRKKKNVKPAKRNTPRD
jgi:hypothetical protein